MPAQEIVDWVNKIDIEILGDAWRNIGNYRYPPAAVATIRARFGRFHDEFQSIINAIGRYDVSKSDQIDAVLNQVAQLSTQELSHDERAFLSTISKMLEVEKSFFAGERTQIPFDENFSLWASHDFSQIKYESPNSVIIDTHAGNPVFSLMAFPKIKGPRIVEFEVEFELEALGSLEDTPRSHSIGGCPVRLVTRHPLYIGSFVKTDYLGLSNRMVVRPLSIRYASRNPKRKIRAWINDDYLELYVNDMFLCRAQLKLLIDSPCLEFTQPGFDISRGQYRITEVFATRWEHSAPPFGQGPEALSAYYSESLEQFPDEPWFWLWRGIARLQLNQLADAEKDIAKAIQLGCPVCYAGFFMGDCLDRQGNIAGAIDWYQKCVDPKGRQVTYFAARVDDSDITEPYMWASRRLNYLAELLPDRELAKKAEHKTNLMENNLFTTMPVTCAAQWMIGINQSIRKGDRRAVDNSIAAAKQQPFNKMERERLEEMLKVVSQYQEYRDPPGTLPQYLDSDLSPWYFRLANEIISKQDLEHLYTR